VFTFSETYLLRIHQKRPSVKKKSVESGKREKVSDLLFWQQIAYTLYTRVFDSAKRGARARMLHYQKKRSLTGKMVKLGEKAGGRGQAPGIREPVPLCPMAALKGCHATRPDGCGM
jgi:hypothetical protein